MGTENYTTLAEESEQELPQPMPNLLELQAAGYRIIEADMPAEVPWAIFDSRKLVLVQRKNPAPATALECYTPAKQPGVQLHELVRPAGHALGRAA